MSNATHLNPFSNYVSSQEFTGACNSSSASHLPKYSNYLGSDQIGKSSLLSIKSVSDKYNSRRNEKKASTLVSRVAKEAVFGEHVLKLCTPLVHLEIGSYRDYH